MVIMSLQNDNQRMAHLLSKQVVHMFELNSPLPEGAEDVKVVSLLSGSCLESSSDIWTFPAETEVQPILCKICQHQHLHLLVVCMYMVLALVTSRRDDWTEDRMMSNAPSFSILTNWLEFVGFSKLGNYKILCTDKCHLFVSGLQSSKKQQAASDTDSGFTQSSGSSTIDAERADRKLGSLLCGVAISCHF